MSRAIVLIGVSQTHGATFATLQGVEDAVDRMEQWARAQGIDQIIRLTDATDKVSIHDIKSKIFGLIDSQDSLEQLIVYFSGHGIVNALSEYWLLSGAPLDSGEAVNVTGSAALAMAGGVPHVVLISDACRTSSNSVQTGRIDGSNIFPNDPNPDAQQAVDIFYATRLGAPALEIAEDRAKYVAIYTQVLADALSGSDPSIVQDGFIYPRPLKDFLKQTVPKALVAKNLPTLVSQSPEAVISSGNVEWIAKFTVPPAAPAASQPAPDAVGIEDLPISAGAEPPAPPQEAPVIRSPEAIRLLVGDAIARTRFGQNDRLLSPDIVMARTGRGLSERARAILKQPTEETIPWAIGDQRGGFVVVGGDLHKATRRDGVLVVKYNATHWSIELDDRDAPSVEVLIEFANGQGILLPAIRGYAGVIQLRENAVEQIHYEATRRGAIDPPTADIQLLRSTFYTASKVGALDLEPQQAAELGAKMQNSKFLDPALAIYAAYAYHSIGKLEKIREMAQFLRRQDIRLFDVSLLARELVKGAPPHSLPLSSNLPILSQGWALIDAFFPDFPELLKPLRQHVGNSLFSQYDKTGMRLLELWMTSDDKQTTPFIITRGDT